MSIIFTVTPIPFGLHNCAFGVCSIQMATPSVIAGENLNVAVIGGF